MQKNLFLKDLSCLTGFINECKGSFKIFCKALCSEVERLVDEYQEPGYYEVSFYSDNVASGVYVFGLQLEGKMFTRKMVVLK